MKINRGDVFPVSQLDLLLSDCLDPGFVALQNMAVQMAGSLGTSCCSQLPARRHFFIFGQPALVRSNFDDAADIQQLEPHARFVE